MELIFYRKQQIPTKKIMDMEMENKGQMCSKVFLAELLNFQLPGAQKVPWTHGKQLLMDFSSFSFFWTFINFSIPTRVCSEVLQLGCPEGISVILLASSLSWATIIWCTVVLVWEKTCSQFTFLVLTTFPSCPSHLSLEGFSLITCLTEAVPYFLSLLPFSSSFACQSILELSAVVAYCLLIYSLFPSQSFLKLYLLHWLL